MKSTFLNKSRQLNNVVCFINVIIYSKFITKHNSTFCMNVIKANFTQLRKPKRFYKMFWQVDNDQKFYTYDTTCTDFQM